MTEENPLLALRDKISALCHYIVLRQGRNSAISTGLMNTLQKKVNVY